MTWFSYHGGHSGQFCDHAKSTLADVVETAIDRGFTHYGLSEHCPRYRDEDLYPGEERLGVAGLTRQFDDYVDHAFKLRDAYADRIELLIGFETEKLPPDTWLAKMEAIRRAHPFDYIVGSVHDIDGCWLDYSAQSTEALKRELGGTDAFQIAYFQSATDMVQRLRPDVVAHLDLVRKYEPAGFEFSTPVLREVDILLEAIEAYGGILDVNCAAFRNDYGPVYPLPHILKRVRHMGIRVTLGDDSHGVDTVGVGLEQSVAAIRAAGFESIAYLTRANGWLQADIDDVAPGKI
ncbi:histidinol-phosphatase [Agrobacterium vitis]|uniref:Histidinol-phosphatase n=1 Tax=Agrobacterium vitis TaxID=373 RepID=A0AAE4WE65_AGRVI|nr:histidinol-phosphatase [Agrobacterium vitis]MCF1499986.1 histidinol-phosphatase [Allorhizobium sp. Av2]MCM2442329.1 histidinol-phosphatase [Agrobacterium vitis]MUZ58739.1 histidinol-phosphatase HisJ family protein [Agrobacterium vitis]MVA66374.1 histidinol-phosphatase HisJ family protein [Agrobacterium vitis]MVA88411.1 histidinol-phosphatase HisJ family protein [Agrobacterium vitis]